MVVAVETSAADAVGKVVLFVSGCEVVVVLELVEAEAPRVTHIATRNNAAKTRTATNLLRRSESNHSRAGCTQSAKELRAFIAIEPCKSMWD